jgi:hypothetical protein
MSFLRSAAVPAILCVLAPPLAALTPALADDYIDAVNRTYESIRPEHRSESILFPAIAKMQPPPAPIASIDKAMMLPHGTADWSTAQEWAMAAPQRGVLEALSKSTQNEQMAFAQPYGADALAAIPDAIQFIESGLYTELGDPPMLAGARFLYLPRLEHVAVLVNVEATRLAGEGTVDQAIKVLGDWLYFSRQMADRELFDEARWGMRSMTAALERIRDVTYVDFRSGQPKLTIEQIVAILERLRTDDGYLMGDRLKFPDGNRVAMEQLIATTFIDRGGVNTATFGQTMARMASSKRPLRLFSEAARWDDVGRTHGNFFDTKDQLKKIYDDWTKRWSMDPFDPQQKNKLDYELTSPSRFAILRSVLPDMGVLFNDRQILRSQLIGTRNSLGVIAFYLRNKQFPPSLAAIRPVFVKVIEADPFNEDRARGRQPSMEYFVPIRDQQRNERVDPQPHEMNVVSGSDNFRVRIGQDQFILYSVGPDTKKDWANNVSGEPAKGAIGDLLVWPPVTSLLRQRAVELGRIR